MYDIAKEVVHKTDLQVKYVIGIEFECIEDAVYLSASRLVACNQ